MKTDHWMILLAVLLLVAGCGRGVDDEPDADGATEVPRAPSPEAVRPGVTILAEGVVQAVQPALPLAFEAGGKLVTVHVEAYGARDRGPRSH